MTQPPTPAYGDRGLDQVDPYVDTVEQPVVTYGSEPGYSLDSGVDDGDTSGTSTKDAATQEATEVKDTALQAGQQVAGTAKEQAQNVASEAGQQTKQLWQETVSQLGEQASGQQQRLAGTLTSFSKELGSMASSSDESGLMTDLAHQASQRGGEIAHWLESRQPKDLLEDVRSFARRRPFAFLAIAATAGVVAGRLTRGLASDAKAKHEITSPSASSTPELASDVQDQEWAVPAEPVRANMSLEEIPTSGTGAGPSFYAPDTDAPGSWTQDHDTRVDGGVDPYGRPGDQGGVR